MAKARNTDKSARGNEVLERIAEAVEKLAGEVEILRGIIDRLQEDFAWALNNDAFRGEGARRERVPPVHITSMPLDPLAPDWHERLNRYRAEDINEADDAAQVTVGSVQRDLFSD
jgi:hypothetical protein